MQKVPSDVWFLSIILVILSCLAVKEVSACGGSKSCSWKTCSETYSAYSPRPSTGSCIYQTSRVSHHYNTHTRSSGCPGSQSCSGRDRGRYLCNSFKYILFTVNLSLFSIKF